MTSSGATGRSLDDGDVCAVRTQSMCFLMSASTAGVVIQATVVHEPAMLSRLTALLGPHAVDQFCYVPDRAGRARVFLSLLGEARQAERVCAKLRRVIGVLHVAVADDVGSIDCQVPGDEPTSTTGPSEPQVPDQ